MVEYKKNISSSQEDSDHQGIPVICSLLRFVFSCNVAVSL